MFFFRGKDQSDDPRPVPVPIPLLIFCQVARVTKIRNNDDKKERHEELGPKNDCFHCVLQRSVCVTGNFTAIESDTDRSDIKSGFRRKQSSGSEDSQRKSAHFW